MPTASRPRPKLQTPDGEAWVLTTTRALRRCRACGQDVPVARRAWRPQRERLRQQGLVLCLHCQPLD